MTTVTPLEKEHGFAIRHGLVINLIKDGRLFSPVEFAVAHIIQFLVSISIFWGVSVLAYTMFYHAWVVSESPATGVWFFGAYTGLVPLLHIKVFDLYRELVIHDHQRISNEKLLGFIVACILYIVYTAFLYAMLGYWVVYRAFVLPSDDHWRDLFFRMVEYNSMHLGVCAFFSPLLCFKPRPIESIADIENKEEIVVP